MHSFLFDLTSNLQFFQRHKGGEYENSHKTLRIGVSNIELTTASTFGKLALPSLIYSSRYRGAFLLLLLWDIWPTALIPRQQLFSTHQPDQQLISVLQEEDVPLEEEVPIHPPLFHFKPPRKDSLVWRPATSTNIRGLSSLSRSWASTWCTGWSISPFQKRKYINIFFSINSGLVLGSSKTSCTSRKDLWCGRSLAK